MSMSNPAAQLWTSAIRGLSVLMGLAILLGAANPAHAVSLLVRDAPGGEDYSGSPPGNYLTGTGGDIYGTVVGGSFIGLALGTYDLQINEGSGYTDFRTYCLEPTQFMAVGTQPTVMTGKTYNTAALTSISGISAADEAYLGVLWANAFADSQTSRDKAAAFQILIWEKVRDTVFNFSQGNFKFDTADSAPAVAIANAWNSNILNQVWTKSTPLEALVSAHSQDILRPVPEPASWALLAAAAVVALPAFRRRMARRS